MSDDATDPGGTESGESSGDPGESTTRTTDDPGDASPDDSTTAATLRRYVNYAVLGGLLLLAFVAVVQFYFSAGDAIQQWVTPEYRSAFRALFNLVVLLLAGLGISVQLRRLAGKRSDSTEK